MSEIRIRPYRRADRRAVLMITEDAFGGYCLECNQEENFGPIAGKGWAERKKEGIDFDLRRHHEHVLVAEFDGQVVGYLCGRLYSSSRTGHIANMAVSPDCQGRGVGKRLIRAALDMFRDEGMEYARIETLAQNKRGLHIYPMFGFKEIGRQVFFFREL